MGIGPIALTLYRRLIHSGVMKVGHSIIDLGSQDLYMDHCENLVVDLFGAVGSPIPNLQSGEAIRSSSLHLMAALGFEYACIDIDGRHGALPFDLNNPLRDHPLPFDIVTNHGTTEHVFDQGNCLRTMHDLCCVGGIMIHCVPMRGYYGHCFYRYDPGLFVDLAEANAYETIGIWMAVDDGAMSDAVVMTPLSEWIEGADLDKNLLLIVVIRKINNAPLIPPIQKMYQC